MTDRRAVRILPDFFMLLDEQLPHERGATSEPTAAESAASDLLDIVETFAVTWDEMPMPISGRPDYRLLILRGRLVHAVAVRGQLSPGGRSHRAHRHRYRPARPSGTARTR